MPKSTTEYSGAEYAEPELTDGPQVKYQPGRYPDVDRALETLNHIALLDEDTACIQYAKADPDAAQEAQHTLESHAAAAVDHGLEIISFDIDLTLTMPEDAGHLPEFISPTVISELQELGYIVGTCSDRPPSNQREAMAEVGQAPHFCIPKEMLHWTSRLIPAETQVHVGDDARRDRDIAEAAGWQHLWPGQYRS